MKSLLSWFFIIFGLTLLVISTAKPVMKVITDKRDYLINKSWWGEHTSPWGDLVYMSYLDNVKKFQEPCIYHFVRPADSSNKNIDLYMCGDSHTDFLPDSVFAHVHSFHFMRNYFSDLQYKLDTTKRNILIIECAERYLRDYIDSRQIFYRFKRNETVYNKSKVFIEPHKYYSSFSIELPDIFNPNINQNLEYNMFNYNFMTGIRYLKANFNYYCFNRASGNVAISDDGAYLFIKESIVPFGIYSYSEPLTENTIDQLVSGINAIYSHYKNEGFSEIYLTVIPNPPTILQPGYYNQMLPRLQNNPSLQMPVIDLYNIYKNHPHPATLYRAGDVHWNNNGLQLWLQNVNSILSRESQKQSPRRNPADTVL